jgi:hypothetical protein
MKQITVWFNYVELPEVGILFMQNVKHYEGKDFYIVSFDLCYVYVIILSVVMTPGIPKSLKEFSKNK